MTQSALTRIRYTILLLLNALSVSIGNTADAENFALLIGVSGYPSLRADLRLHGPINDVILMKDGFLKLGIPSTNIQVLADGVSGSALPTRNNILNELKNLTKKAHKGDWVVIYWAGHGSIQPGKEENGFDEIFLPYDIGSWDGKIGSVTNAILDDEIGDILDEYARRNIYVWAIFDTCHAGGMSRTGDCSPAGCPRERGIASYILGIPQEKMNMIRKINEARGVNSSISIKEKNYHYLQLNRFIFLL